MASLSGSTSRSIMRLLSTYWPGLQLSESLSGASRSITHIPGKLVLAVVRRS